MSTSPVGRNAGVSHASDARSAAPLSSTGTALPERRDGVAASRHGSSLTALRQLARNTTPAGQAPTDSVARNSALTTALLAHVPAADRAAAATAIPAILAAARAAGSTDPNQLGYVLATAQLESDFGAHMVESGHSEAWYNRVYGCEDGNRPGTSDGYVYRGRGYVQTTHAGRYAQISHALGLADVPAVQGGKTLLDERGRPRMLPALVAHPEKLAQPKLAAAALVVGVKSNLYTGNPAAALGTTIPPGRPPGDADFYHARGIVNGIVKDQAEAIARNAAVYARVIDGFRDTLANQAVRR